VEFNVPAPFEKNAPNYVGFSSENPRTLDCGSSVPDRIPYYLLAAAMIATTFYQQRQMQRASPAGSQQQQAITRIMPLLFGIWGFLFPAGLVLYWTTTNLFQIGQQGVMLRRGMIGGSGPGKTTGDGQTKGQLPPSKSPKPGGGGTSGSRRPGNPNRKPSSGGSGSRPSGSGDQASGRQNGGQGPAGGSPPAAGGTSGGDRKKRRKR
jgi:YidC/Oxa1 family membrane protein insertase